ncbi:predicted protein [Histoplasma capsulatum G186AR]|uniref:Uncharacterized protein n=1 Tax=Ajellomyces capsulatus (strain G186AR / H82 / ATCC MYA-2454 / RMSCC 2432) TaxID=447093 RepID=C0NP66_AJECG|nr:uncharacterized protein HCBG_04946 [Histoplasma capsulatum G186AR]EEH06726.1 predicted protein [Histoplasma capsulatum G186AR]
MPGFVNRKASDLFVDSLGSWRRRVVKIPRGLRCGWCLDNWRKNGDEAESGITRAGICYYQYGQPSTRKILFTTMPRAGLSNFFALFLSRWICVSYAKAFCGAAFVPGTIDYWPSLKHTVTSPLPSLVLCSNYWVQALAVRPVWAGWVQLGYVEYFPP